MTINQLCRQLRCEAGGILQCGDNDMPPKDELNVKKVMELKEALIDYFCFNSFSDNMSGDTAVEREASDAIGDFADKGLEKAARIAVDDLGLLADDLGNLYSFAEKIADLQDQLSVAIMKASPRFDVV